MSTTRGLARLEDARARIIGQDLEFSTPYGRRRMFYADYTASGRGLAPIEDQIREILESYANTHTEDDYSGRRSTRLYHAALDLIHRLVNAGPRGVVLPAGSGSTAALKKLLEILGLYVAPVFRERIAAVGPLAAGLDRGKPVVFIGPYEHHTNELMWREAFVEVIVVGLNGRGRMDLADLEHKLTDPRFAERMRFGSFSAGSNITGLRTPVYDVARLCHRHGCPVFFDFAAIAPYVEIDMNKDGEAYFDAIFFSPHKFLGGPGSAGILVINDHLYRKDLAPTTAGGGTVVFVGPTTHDFSDDIETRESAGTPPILQTIRAALAMDLKDKIGADVIGRIETGLRARFLDGLGRLPAVEVIGRPDDPESTPILSFNIRHGDRILHPKFVARLLNDLFGIQSRAGCSCAGPYGHLLLDINHERSLQYRQAIQCGYQGVKPGWVRINLHYTFTEEDVDFLLAALAFIARRGAEFLRLYLFDRSTGEWMQEDEAQERPILSVDWHPSRTDAGDKPLSELRCLYLAEAEAEAERLALLGEPAYIRDTEAIEGLKFFRYIRAR
ncbi:MAG: aminotransferase class V-fold PLP-dependent enzyme [Candidatus Aminicenantes bacterium]|nr:aminotransferase class V-fold PLP-dependent enzyme [Candidatus Aminicenantes bacterium]